MLRTPMPWPGRDVTGKPFSIRTVSRQSFEGLHINALSTAIHRLAAGVNRVFQRIGQQNAKLGFPDGQLRREYRPNVKGNSQRFRTAGKRRKNQVGRLVFAIHRDLCRQADKYCK